MVNKLDKLVFALLGVVLVASIACAVVELDGDSNNAVDISLGGTNGTTAPAARTALGLDTLFDAKASKAVMDGYTTSTNDRLDATETAITTKLPTSTFNGYTSRFPTADEKAAMTNANAPDASNPVATIADLQFVNYSSQSVTVTTGGSPTGTVANTHNHSDGLIYSVPEVTGTPGYDVRFTFSGVTHFNQISTRFDYLGSTIHNVYVQIEKTPFDGTAWDNLNATPYNGTTDYSWATFDIPVDTAYINSGTVRVRFYHASAGNGSHSLAVDYIGLLHSSRGGANTVHNQQTQRDAPDAHPASAITNTPAGSIAATNQQDVNNELATEKVDISTNTEYVHCDGSGDNVGIQAAIDAATGQTRIVLNGKLCDLGSTTVLIPLGKHYMTIEGAGPGGTTIVQSTGNNSSFQVGEYLYVGVDDWAYGTHAVYGTTIRNLRIDNSNGTKTNTIGIDLRGSNNGTFEDLTFSGIKDGIKVQSISNWNHFDRINAMGTGLENTILTLGEGYTNMYGATANTYHNIMGQNVKTSVLQFTGCSFGDFVASNIQGIGIASGGNGAGGGAIAAVYMNPSGLCTDGATSYASYSNIGNVKMDGVSDAVIKGTDTYYITAGNLSMGGDVTAKVDFSGDTGTIVLDEVNSPSPLPATEILYGDGSGIPASSDTLTFVPNPSVTAGYSKALSLTNTVTQEANNDMMAALVVSNVVTTGAFTGGLSVPLHFIGENSTQSTSTNLLLDNYGASNASPNVNILHRSARGSSTAPRRIKSGDKLMNISARMAYAADDSTDAAFGSAARVSYQAYAAEDQTATAQGAYATIWTTLIGSTTYSEKFRITDAGRVGIGTTAPENALDINSASGANLQLTYNDSNGSAANKVNFAVSSSGDLTITPSGGDASVAGTWSATTLQSTVATGTAPLIVASTTNVPNLNASSLNGATFAVPGVIGGTTPSIVNATTFVSTAGEAVPLYNDTGSTIPAGSVVTQAAGNDYYITPTGANATNWTGVTLAAITTGTTGNTVHNGPVAALMKDSNACTRGYYVSTSDTAGRVVCSATAPTTVAGVMQFIGIAQTSVGAGTDALVTVLIRR
jgi:hypothetical protein